MLAQARYRVASADLRGHSESSLGWASITRTDVAGDLAALTGHLGGRTGSDVRQDQRAALLTALERARATAYPAGEYVGQESFMRAG
ncbi:MAG TPA: hypothetical protein VMH35_26520 [Streptosporangiaceae bacterium]|nr:hypothetical protein [Streptosporangiaceae bacterium]